MRTGVLAAIGGGIAVLVATVPASAINSGTDPDTYFGPLVTAIDGYRDAQAAVENVVSRRVTRCKLNVARVVAALASAARQHCELARIKRSPIGTDATGPCRCGRYRWDNFRRLAPEHAIALAGTPIGP